MASTPNISVKSTKPVPKKGKPSKETGLGKKLSLLKTKYAAMRDQYDYIRSCKSVSSSMALLEHKTRTFWSPPVPRVLYVHKDCPLKGKAIIPDILAPDDSVGSYTYEDTKESLVMRDTFRTLFGDKHYRFRLSTALNMSSNGAGIVNSTINNAVLNSQADFISLSTVFNEFFIKAFEVHWMPNSRYQYPLGGTSTISIANLPIGVADLQHGAAAYTSLGAMADNFALGYHSTGDPFKQQWINTEKVSDTTVAEISGVTQSWCTTNNAGNYQGTLQILSQSSPPALPFSQVLGTFMVHWDVLFRVRT